MPDLGVQGGAQDTKRLELLACSGVADSQLRKILRRSASPAGVGG